MAAYQQHESGDQPLHLDGLPLGTRGGMKFRHTFPADGEYRFTIQDIGVDLYSRVLETRHTLILLVDDREVFRQSVGGSDDLRTVDRLGAPGRAEVMQRFADVPVQVKAGTYDVAVTFIAIALVDKVGRRPILLIGSAGMTVSLGLMALAFTQAVGSGKDITLPDPWAPIALVAANAFVVFFGASWGPLVWVLLGEMFPNRIRAAALGVAAMAQWLANFAITLTFPPMLSAFGASIPYLMYAIFAALSFVFVFSKVPETKGIELEDMGDERVGRAAH